MKGGLYNQYMGNTHFHVPSFRSGLVTAAAAAILSAGPGTAVFAGGPDGGQRPATVSRSAPQGWRTNVREFAMANFRHPAWGASHAARDYSLAVKLAAADKVQLDDDVLYAAAWLHDMGAFAPWADPKADHAEVALSSAAEVLAGAGFPAAKLDTVRGAIRTHMHERTPEGPEALYLHDADALEWLGAIGAARLLALVDPNGAAPTTPMMAAGLEDMLAKVPARVLSPAGRALLPARKAELEQFLRNLRAESDNFRQL